MIAISSFWLTMIRAQSVCTDGLAPCDGAHPAMRIAWA